MMELIKDNKNGIFEITCIVGLLLTTFANNIITLKISAILLILQFIYFYFRILKNNINKEGF